jgi:MFS family permease
LACVISGQLSSKLGTKHVAQSALFLSCVCCLLSPLCFGIDSSLIFVGFLIFWGMVVIADSPLFSTMVAHSADPEIKGTALTIANCIGFAITIISIQLLNMISGLTESNLPFMLLAIGPVLGLISLIRASI